MRSLSGRVNAGVALVCLLIAVAVAAIGAIGINAVRAATVVGATIADDELTTVTVTSRLGRQVDKAFSATQELRLSTDTARRAVLAASLYDPVIPAVDAALADLTRIHSDDTADEVADLGLLDEQWRTARALLNPATRPNLDVPAPGHTAAVGAAFDALDSHIDELIAREHVDAQDKQVELEEIAIRMASGIAAAVTLAIAVTVGLGVFASRRIRRYAEPAREQMEFAETLQLAETEEEAHHLLQRHLERTVPAATVTVLNCNNSADRLEPTTPVPAGSPLAESLQHAEPRSCLAVRSGRPQATDANHLPLLGCPVCGTCPGRSTCTPLTVAGAVIGSVLLNRPRRYSPAEQQRLRDSVGQAAPVLANLRNLAIAEFRAATDSLTGLPNKRAVADSLKRMLAQASRTLTPACLLMIDLDHFKDINDRYGHPVGDQALASVGAALRSALRESDFAGRNGGEEFAVMLPDTDITGASITAEKIRAAIAEIALPGHAVKITASIGIAAYPDHATNTEQLERLADSALYLAKRTGRDRVEIATAIDGTLDSVGPDVRFTPEASRALPDPEPARSYQEASNGPTV